ncbi:hypothetical protein ACP70R_040906 [Stipagrostis hirtigluma subsp. patula]
MAFPRFLAKCEQNGIELLKSQNPRKEEDPSIPIEVEVRHSRLDMAPAVAVAVVLGDIDLLREILIRVHSAADLVRAAATCKPFLCAAANRPLLRRFRRLHPLSCPRVLGCLVVATGRRGGTPPQFLSISASYAAAAAGHGGDFALSFLPGGGWLGGASWQILDCRNGLLLLKNPSSKDLAVADPMARGCVALPPPPAARTVGYGLVADEDDSSVFQVVCVSRDAVSRAFRALVLSSGELTWADVADLPGQPDLATSRAMQANRSLYWKLEGGQRMVAFSTATMGFSVLELPPSLRQLGFDLVEKGEDDGNVLHLLTMSDFCIELWAGTAGNAGENGMTWRQVDKSVRFHKMVATMVEPQLLSQHELVVTAVAAGVAFVRLKDHLFSINLETMKLRMLSKQDCSSALIYPYTVAWPPSFLTPAGQGAS